MADLATQLSEDEEEILVYVEFEGSIGNNTLNDKQFQLDITGIDTDHPIMQINGRFYEGTYEDAVGTYLFFEEDKNPTVDDPIFDINPTLKYFQKTKKLLKMQRVFTKQHTEVLGDSQHPDCIPNLKTINEAGVPPKYQKDALTFWQNIRDKRLSELNTYLEKQRVREEQKSQGIMPESDSDEDNPFAIYKQKTNPLTTSVVKESDENINNISNSFDTENTKVLDIIDEANIDKICKNVIENNEVESSLDPQPSTSKETILEKGPTYTAGHIEIIKPSKKKKGKLTTKKPLEKIKKKKHSSMKEKGTTPRTEQDKECDDTSNKSNLNISESNNSSELISDNAYVALIESVNDKNSVKLSKREAKMKEISENLKKIAEKYEKGKRCTWSKSGMLLKIG
ncbi:uncharacterized protein [Prorops nasuta]|uniref:uncharacterized protein n=1 Tax=Prorops nasuta TaxID=863751 RepID=UPI0034CE3210